MRQSDLAAAMSKVSEDLFQRINKKAETLGITQTDVIVTDLGFRGELLMFNRISAELLDAMSKDGRTN
jgi:hypothetical protein